MAAWFSASACVAAVIACWMWRLLAKLQSRGTSSATEGTTTNAGQTQTNLLRTSAIVLGGAAILCQGLAVRSLWLGGVLLPIPSPQADLDYYQRLQGRLTEIQASTQLSAKQFELARALRERAVEWTARQVVDANDIAVQRAALLALAYDIRPVPGSYPEVKDYLDAEADAIENRLATAMAEMERLSQQQAELAADFARLSELREAAAETPAQDSTEGELLQANLKAVAVELTAAETDWQQLRREVGRLRARQAWRTDRMQEPGGLSVTAAELRLPVVIPGGLGWWLAVWLIGLLAAGGMLKLVASRATNRPQPLMLLVVGLYLAQWWLMVRV